MKSSTHPRTTLKRFEDIIEEIEELATKSDRQLRLKITLIDKTTLRISETFLEGKLQRYSYYHLDHNNELIVGWDSAPHHSHLENFPFHMHVGKGRELKSSAAINLEQVLSYIKERIESQ